MARGRMISKSLSTSEKFASLHEQAGKLAEFAQTLYMLLVAHADDWGCQQGDVFTVKHAVHPTSPRKLADFETALKHLHNAGLVAWYDADDKRVVYIRSFSAHQSLKGHDKDGRKRTFPPPPENISNFAEVAQSRPKSPKPALREENLTEEKRTYMVTENPVTAEADEDLATGVTGADIHAFLRAFCDLYSKHRFGAKYLVRRQIDVPIVRRLLAVYDLQRLEKLAVILFTTDNEWISGTDRGIGILSTKAAWLDGLLSEHDARRRGVA
jgi:hypothetical protein